MRFALVVGGGVIILVVALVSSLFKGGPTKDTSTTLATSDETGYKVTWVAPDLVRIELTRSGLDDVGWYLSEALRNLMGKREIRQIVPISQLYVDLSVAPGGGVRANPTTELIVLLAPAEQKSDSPPDK